jgi:branched-chain amino acid transport system substrate-binding protein
VRGDNSTNRAVPRNLQKSERRPKMKKGRIAFFMVLVAAFWGCFLCQQGKCAERELVIGAACDLSGPWAPTGTAMANGRKAYIRYVNEKLGGIKGVNVRIVVVDTAYNSDREIAAYKKFRDQDKAIFMLNINSGAAYAIERMMMESGKGMVHSHSADPTTAFLGPESWYFASYLMTPDAESGLFSWWMDNRWKKSPKPKVALAHSDVTPGHVAAIFMRDYLTRNGFEIVSDLMLSPKPVDTTSAVLNIKKSGADVVVGTQTDAGLTVMLKDMKRFDIRIPALPGCCLDESAVKVLGDAGVGALLDFPHPVWNDTDNAGVRLVHNLYKEWYPGEQKRENYGFFWGWIGSAIAVEAIKKAVDKVGYEGIVGDIEKGRKVVRDVMQNEMRGFDCMGMTPPLIYTANDHRAFVNVRIYEVASGGEYKFLGMGKAVPLRPEQKASKWWEDAIEGATKK